MSVDRAQRKGSLVLENGDWHPSIEDKIEGQTEKSRYIFLENMDAIACGVQARFEENCGFSRRVTETTVDIARELGVPEAEIKRWAASRLARLIRDVEKLNVIKTRLERLQGSFVEQTDNKRPPHRTIRSDPT